MKKLRWEESEKEERRSEKKEKESKKEDAGARKNRKLAKRCVFPMVCGSEGSRSRLANAAGAERSGQMEIRNYMLLWCKEDFEVKILKAPHARTTLGIAMLKKFTALWREAHFEVKSVENCRARITFGS